jgi:hypothetical protein
MAMAPTTGYVGPEYFGMRAGYDLSATQTNYRTFGGRVFLQPASFRSDSANWFYQGYETQTEWLLALDHGVTATDLDISTHINGDEAQWDKRASSSADLDNEWVSGRVTGQDQHIQSEVISSWEDNQVNPRRLLGEISYTQTFGGVQDPDNLYAVYVKCENDVLPSPSVYFEKSGRHPTSTVGNEWTPHDENETCSAWLMVQQVCHNTNRIIEEDRPAWSIPIFDDNAENMT